MSLRKFGIYPQTAEIGGNYLNYFDMQIRFHVVIETNKMVAEDDPLPHRAAVSFVLRKGRDQIFSFI